MLLSGVELPRMLKLTLDSSSKPQVHYISFRCFFLGLWFIKTFQVEWTCRDSTTPPNEIHYHFPIKFVSTPFAQSVLGLTTAGITYYGCMHVPQPHQR